MKRVFPIMSLIIGTYWLITGLKAGVWVKNRVGGGFVPSLVGGLAIIFSLLILLSEFKKTTVEDNNEEKTETDQNQKKTILIRTLLPFVAVILTIACSYAVGLVVSLGLFILLWMLLYQKAGVLSSLLTAILTSVSIYLVFEVWLQVRLPVGVISKLF